MDLPAIKKLSDFRENCRLCLEKCVQGRITMFDLFTSAYDNKIGKFEWMDDERSLRILDVISLYVPDYTVNEGDDFSKNMCEVCFTKLLDFHDFRQQIMTSDKTLLNLKETEQISLATSQEDAGMACVSSQPDLDTGLNDELRMNFDENYDELICVVCSKKFTTNGRFQNHLVKKHSVRNDESIVKQFDCDKCEKSYTTLANLTLHKRSHSGDKPFKCQDCDRAFYKEISLLNHSSIHTGLKKHKCDECQRFFTSANILQQHRKTHSNDRPHKCSSCPRAFFAKNDLSVHQRIHTKELPFLCCQCGKKFSRKTHLNMHLRTHSGERPYTCEFCNKSFAQSGDLTAHIRIHTGNKPYECRYCEKTFNQSSARNAHTRIHTGERKYVCRVCSKAFTQSSSLKRHIKTHIHSDNSSQDEISTDSYDTMINFVNSL